MANFIFQEAVQHLLQAEGGYTDNPADPGKCTKYGVTLRTLQDFKKNPNLDVSDIRSMGMDTASEIYLERYYRPLGLTECHNRLACIAILDQAANRGLNAVNTDLSQILGYKLNPSYPRMVDILNFFEDEFDKLPMLNVGFMIDFLIKSQEHYRGICKVNPKLSVFLEGWLNRVNRLFYLMKTNGGKS